MSTQESQDIDPVEQVDGTNPETAQGGEPEGSEQVSDTGENQLSAEDQAAADEASRLAAEAEAKSQESKKESRRQRAEQRLKDELQKSQEELQFLRNLVTKGTGTQSVSNVSQPEDEEPRLEDFDGRPITDYIRARDEFREGKLLQRLRDEAKQAAETEKLQARQRSLIDEAKKELTDWDDVMVTDEDEVFPVQDTVNFIVESDRGPWIAHYLKKNPDEHEALNKMSHNRRIAELGKLEERLKSTKQEAVAVKKVTSAPAKLTNAQGKGTIVNLDPAAASRQGRDAWKAANEARKAAAASKSKR